MLDYSLDVIEHEGLVANAAARGQQLLDGLDPQDVAAMKRVVDADRSYVPVQSAYAPVEQPRSFGPFNIRF